MAHVVTAFLRHRGDVLLVRRSDEVGTYRGKWGGVSGFVERDPDDDLDSGVSEWSPPTLVDSGDGERSPPTLADARRELAEEV
ncbi:initiation factor 2B, partial [Halobium palmae]